LKQVPLAQGEVVFEPGAPLNQIYFPQSGLISLLIITKDGGSVEASTVGREGAVGLHGGLGKRTSFTRATTQIGGTFSVIGASRFGEIADGNATVRDLISRYTEVLWAEAQQLTACNVLHDASSRLSRWLLQSADRTGDDNLMLTQEYLALMVGVRRTTITLLAQAMQEKGLIRYRRGRIVILDRPGLEACACECYHVIRHDRLPHTLGMSLSNS
jgi:CRP-like cAMP-binding protein